MRKVLRQPEVIGAVKLSATTLWREEKAGRFPRRITLGANSVGWFEDEIEAWLSSKAQARRVLPQEANDDHSPRKRTLPS